MHLIGIDVGTGGSRAVLIDMAGRIVASATVEHKPFVSIHTGWAEQDPRDWWRASAAAIRSAITQAGIAPDGIKAVGLSGQMHGAVLLDADDEVLRPAIIWCDQRSGDQCRKLTSHVGASRLIELTCNPALTGFTLPKLLWVRDHEPETWQRVRSVLLPKDFVRFKLTGDKATDVADASGTLLLDVASRRWSGEMLAAAEMKVGLLPRVYESQEITGTVSHEAAEETGLKADTPVIRRRRSGCGRSRSRDCPARNGERHDRNFRRSVRCNEHSRARSKRPCAHVLSRDSRTLARHGRHAGRGPLAALVPGSIRRTI
jgi:xylulokinase